MIILGEINEMKKLVLVNGTMGVGKTTICEQLYKNMNKLTSYLGGRVF